MAEEFQNFCLLNTGAIHDQLHYGDGPLQFNVRHYIAIMGLPPHTCRAVMWEHIENFLSLGGNKSWLTSLESVPVKLQKLKEINEILATDPWLLTPERISKFLRNPGLWSVSELMQAILILTNIQMLTRFTSACDMLKREEICDVPSCCPPPDSANSSDSETLSVLPDLPPIPKIKYSIFSSWYQETGDGCTESISVKSPSNFEIVKFLDDASMTYHEFRERLTGQKGAYFSIHDYSWQDQGYTMANRLYMDIGVSLDEEFSAVQTMSMTLLSEADCSSSSDASAYTEAIWNYVLMLHGIQIEFYHHNEVNQRLSSELKAFIKLLACFPEKLHHPMFNRFSKNFKHFEQRHLNALVQEAKFQAILMYALHAMSNLS
jgi:sestrin 1/3